LFRRQPTPPVKEPEPEPEADEQEDNQDLRNKVQKLEEEMQQTSSQVTKLENTVETLRTVLTQKIQSEAQTVCSLTHYVGYLESVSIIRDLNVSIILESTICKAIVKAVFYPAKPTSIVVFW